MEVIFDLICDYFDKKENHFYYKNRILEQFSNCINDLSKEELLKFIKNLFNLNKLYDDKSELIIRVLPEILANIGSLYNEISDIIYESGFGDLFIKKYKNIQKNNKIDNDLFNSYNYLLEVLKKINIRYPICSSFKKCKKLENMQSNYYKSLNKCDIKDIYGIQFYKTKLKENIHILLQKNDYEFIRVYYKNYKKLIDTDSNLFEQMINDDLFIYIMQLSKDNPFIKEMQEYFDREYSSYFVKLNNKQKKYTEEFKNGDYTNFDKYFNICNVVGNYIDDNLANYIFSLAFNNSFIVKEESVIAAIRSLGNAYLNSMGIEGYSIVIKNASDMNLKSGSSKKYPNKVITINKSLIKLFLKYQNINLFITLFHEIEHAKSIKKNNNYFEYQMHKEEIIIRYIPNYYFDNYKFFLSEIDARLNGTICTFRYLEQLIPDKVDFYKESLLKHIKKENELLEHFNKSNEDIYSFGDKIDDIFSKVVKANPSIIKRNPLFQIEYNLDGSLKDDELLLKTYDHLHRNEKKIAREIIDLRLNTNLFILFNKLRDFIYIFNNNLTDIQKYYINVLSTNILNYIQSDNKNEIITYLYNFSDIPFVLELINKIKETKEEKAKK